MEFSIPFHFIIFYPMNKFKQHPGEKMIRTLKRTLILLHTLEIFPHYSTNSDPVQEFAPKTCLNPTEFRDLK